ncbi:hypothetical protein DPMN_126346 [Dreissena polymorpha]|uniref:C2H2-type domain-containing protein n=2 Tax=Dreissena polymorpha TaxID=45954 RepID=A0A9D4JVI4_DREPO|nr:hypothetical protein DPMN_126346 [Dreissena polymorpha]
MHGGNKLTSYDLQVLDQWLRENDDEYLKQYSKHLNHRPSNKNHNNIPNGKHDDKIDVLNGNCTIKLSSAMPQKKNIEITGEKKYKCELCGYASNHSNHLKRHKRIHTGERQYKCEVCGYTCNRNDNLKTHMMKHTGERLYMCELCGYASNHSNHLKRHKRIHTGERLYKCEVCGKEYTWSSYLKEHKNKHSQEEQVENK